MSYLAMSAAPIDNEMAQSYNNETPINKKRQNHTKTQKYRQPSSDFNPQKVNSVLKMIHNSTPEDDNDLGNYNPKGTAVTSKHSENFQPLNPFEFPDKPVSVGGERTKKQEGMTNIDESLVPQPADNDDLKLQELQNAFMNDAQVRDYYKNLIPTYASNNKQSNNSSNKQYYSSETAKNLLNSYSNESNQVLIEKLNYMINLLEEQQDQKTGSVTEEVVLYSFLGVFIIFVVDSFARVGKYVR
jgi:hypothetical protein